VNTKQPPHGHARRLAPLIENVSMVVPMPAKAVLLRAEGALEGSLVDENLRHRQVGVEAATNRK
jgi:hypothetical protein